jgi:hypothetical protein
MGRNSLVKDALGALVTCLALTGVSAADGDSRVISDDWLITLGGYLVDLDTDAAVGSGGVLGTSIQVEDDLGIEGDKSFARMDGQYRFNERHAMGWGLWSLSRDGSRALQRQIDWDGNTYDVGAVISSEFDTSWLRLDWRYSMLHTDKGEAGFAAGISAYQFDFVLEGEASVSGGGTAVRRGEESFVAPVPTFGLFINYAITPSIVFRAKADLLDVRVGNLDGSLLDTMLLFDWYFSDHVGVGGGVNKTDIDLKNTGDDPYSAQYKQSGFLAYVALVF